MAGFKFPEGIVETIGVEFKATLRWDPSAGEVESKYLSSVLYNHDHSKPAGIVTDSSILRPGVVVVRGVWNPSYFAAPPQHAILACLRMAWPDEAKYLGIYLSVFEGH